MVVQQTQFVRVVCIVCGVQAVQAAALYLILLNAREHSW